ncbi:type III secretion system chaperone [Bordetella genomosp. 13]|uniref:type III secretion system chaperone n=1 Tax=Bordetella genomosp. 13 TaxID=463040 RepID=UPI0011A45FA6|nr:type III secretion system chaperone [Bordetella genomosp. 13]
MRAEVFRSLVADLARSLDKPELPVNDAQVCSIRIDAACWVHISYSDKQDAVHWTSVMCSTAGRDAAALHRYLLQCNLDGALTAGGFFGLSELNQAVVYRYHEPLECLHAQRFAAIFETFSANAVRWSERLSGRIDRLAPPTASSQAAAGGLSGSPRGLDPLLNRA